MASCELHWDSGVKSTPRLQCRRPGRVYVPEVSDLGVLFGVSCFACAFARWVWFVFFARVMLPEYSSSRLWTGSDCCEMKGLFLPPACPTRLPHTTGIQPRVDTRALQGPFCWLQGELGSPKWDPQGHLRGSNPEFRA